MPNEGVLQFTLGLATAGFIHAVGKASAVMKGFSASVLGIGSVTAGVMAALDKGAGLEQLHRRTGASITALYELQKGFQAAGLSGDDVSMSLFQMQKSLGGVNEMGESTPDIFRKLGLSIDQLKRMDAPGQITAIMRGLNRLGTSDAASAAAGIFGRFNAANIIQLSHSAKEFTSAMQDSADTAKNWQRIAPILNDVHLMLLKVKSIATGMFAGIAGGIAPAMEEALKYLNSFKSTLTSIGNGVGQIFSGMTEAFREGKIGELMNLTFAASVEFLTNMLIGTLGSSEFWAGIWNTMVGGFVTSFGKVLEILASIGQVLLAALDTAFQKFYEGIGKTALGRRLGLGGYKAQTFSQNLDRERKNDAGGMEAVKAITGMGQSFFRLGAKELTDASKRAFAASGGAEQDKLKNFWAGIKARTPALPKSADTTPGSGDLSSEKFVYRPEFTGLEKMGFVGAGANPSQEYARRTADGVAKMCGYLETTVNLLSGGAGQTNSI